MITDFDLLDGVLAAIEHATPMVVLHREEDVAAHAVASDVDVAVGVDPRSVVASIAPCLEREGILPILVFHYDRGSYSFFFSDARATGGAQVDVVHDPRGAGRYGLRTDAVLSRREPGVRWPRPDPLDEALYVLRKRLAKGDAHGVEAAREDVRALGAERLRDRADEILSPSAASAVAAALAGDDGRPLGAAALWRSRAMRPSRLTRRCGYWAHVTGAAARTAAQELSQRMGRLISADSADDPGLPFLLNSLWRPRLVVSAGRTRAWPQPDLILNAGSEGLGGDDLAGKLVAAMHRSALGRLDPGRPAVCA